MQLCLVCLQNDNKILPPLDVNNYAPLRDLRERRGRANKGEEEEQDEVGDVCRRRAK